MQYIYIYIYIYIYYIILKHEYLHMSRTELQVCVTSFSVTVILSSFVSIQTEKERKDSSNTDLFFSELFSKSTSD